MLVNSNEIAVKTSTKKKRKKIQVKSILYYDDIVINTLSSFCSQVFADDVFYK